MNQSCSRSTAFLKLSQTLRGVRSAGGALSVRVGELGDKSDMGSLFRDAKALARARQARGGLRNEVREETRPAWPAAVLVLLPLRCAGTIGRNLPVSAILQKAGLASQRNGYLKPTVRHTRDKFHAAGCA
jgi:hypothetical protein